MVSLTTLTRYYSQNSMKEVSAKTEEGLNITPFLSEPLKALSLLEEDANLEETGILNSQVNCLQLFGSERDCYRRSLCVDSLRKPHFQKAQQIITQDDTKERLGYLEESQRPSSTSIPTSISSIILELVPWNDLSLKALFNYYQNEIREKDVAVCVGLLSLRNDQSSNWETWKYSGDTVTPQLPLSLFSRLILALSSQEISSNESDSHKSRSPLDIFIDVVLECLPSLDWQQVARCLDFPSFYVKDTKVLENLVNVYKKATGDTYFPAHILMKRWNNVRGQLSFLAASLSCTYPKVNFWDLSPKVAPFESVAVKLDETYAITWSAVPLIDTLLELAETEHYMAVRLIFDIPLKHCPEVLLLALSQCEPRWSKMYRELVHILFVLFFDNHPNFMPVARRLYYVNADLLKYGIVEAWKKSPSCLTRILDVCQDLKVVPEVLQHSNCSQFSIDLAVLAARREYLNLEKWLTDEMKENGPEFFQACIEYLTKKIQSFEEKPGASGMIFNLEATAAMFKVLHSFVHSMPSGLVDSLNLLFANYVRMNPRMDTTSNKALNDLSQSKSVSSTETTGPASSDVFSSDIEEETNSFFKKIFSSKLSVDEGIELLEKYKASSDVREQQLFACTIHNLFDEYRFFPNYPEKVLKITGELFGALVERQLVTALTLGIALRYVLEALRRPGRMTLFGLAAVKRFQNRLSEWPQYCAHITHIAHLKEEDPALFESIRKNAKKVNEEESNFRSAVSSPISAPLKTEDSKEFHETKPVASSPNATFSDAPEQVMSEMAGMSLNDNVRSEKIETYVGFGTPLSLESVLSSSGYNTSAVATPEEEIQEKIHFIFNNLSSSNLEDKAEELAQCLEADFLEWFSQYLVVKRACIEQNFQELYVAFLEKLQKFWNKVFQLVLSKSYEYVSILLSYEKIRFSTSDRTLLKNMGSWIGILTLARNKPILAKDLDLKNILLDAYSRGRLIAAIPFTAKVLDSCKKSKIFRPPNPWLMAILGLLKELYNLPDLKLNLKFEVEVLCKNISVDLREVHVSDLLKDRPLPSRDGNPDFSIKPASFSSPFRDIPSSHKGVSAVDETTPSHVEFDSSTKVPSKSPVVFGDMKLDKTESIKWDSESYKDKNISHLSAPQALYMAATAPPANAAAAAATAAAVAAAAEGVTVIPNLGSYIVVNSSLSLLKNIPELKRLLPVAVDRAVREIIQPVVERSCLIASITSRELVLKDFALDKSAEHLRQAAYKMGQSLASCLALVTSKEPLRVSLSSHLRNLLVQAVGENELIEQTVQTFCNDNINVGCFIIEKAASERLLREVDDNTVIREAIAFRNKNPSDEDLLDSLQTNFVLNLPSFLYPRPGEMSSEFFSVYEDFAKVTVPSQENLVDSPILREPSPTGNVTSSVLGKNDRKDGLEDVSKDNRMRIISSQEAVVAVYRCCELAIDYVRRSGAINSDDLSRDEEVMSRLHKVSSILEQVSDVEDVCFVTSQKLFRQLLDNSNHSEREIEMYQILLELLKNYCPKLRSEVFLAWLSQIEDSKSYPVLVIQKLLQRRRLIKPVDYDKILSRKIETEQSVAVIEFAANLLFRLICLERVSLAGEWPASLEIFKRVVDAESRRITFSETVWKLLEYLVNLETGSQSNEAKSPFSSSPLQSTSHASSLPIPLEKENISRTLSDWMTLCLSEESISQVKLLDVLRNICFGFRLDSDESCRELFFQIATELSCDSCRRNLLHRDAALADPGNPNSAVVITKLSGGAPYQVTDTYVMLVMNLARNASFILSSKSQTIQHFRISLLNGFLNGNDVYARLGDPRPFYRLLSDLIYELDAENKDANEILRGTEGDSTNVDLSDFQVLSLLTSALHTIQPQRAPCFAFCWLELVSCRLFMSRLLFLHSNKGWPLFHRLLIDALLFLEPYLKEAFLPKSIKTFFKGFLRLLLTLLHDVPEFLCEYCFTLCDSIPPNCTQLRNLILSAFPRDMRLPDPFLPDLKVDTLPEMSISPRVVTKLSSLSYKNIRQLLDHILSSRAKAADLIELRNRLLLSRDEAQDYDSIYNISAINALVLYVCRHAISQSQQVPRIINMSPHMDVLEFLATELTPEGRYYVLNAIANQLRYPNTHTHYCSCVLLYLFADAKSEILKEQITRVLVERLIANRPHPWGLLVTFIELIKNPRYRFWSCSFVRCTPEIEKLFDNVARTCIANTSGGH
ncbi:CCR4-NOT transcription complex subunit 1 [Galdieria sulphuraria]|nr:CCR4-NOT transcription complex subunit 1 [Galdieria sulphuraria]